MVAGVRLEGMVEGMHEASAYRRVEVITGRRRRRNWTAEEKSRIVAESAVGDANISDVARRHGVSRGLLTVWRRAARIVAPADPASETGGFVPVSVAPSSAATGAETVAGRLDVDLRAGRVQFIGAVEPGLARVVLAALRGAA